MRNERGAVTAETAVALPLIAAFAMGLAWLLSLGVTQARAVDAAREVARVSARGDSESEAKRWGREIAPAGSRIRVRAGDESIVVTVRTPVRSPGGLFGFLPDVSVRARAVAAPEEGS